MYLKMSKRIFSGIVILMVTLSMFFGVAAVASTKRPLVADQAFKFSTTVKSANEVLAKFSMTPGYYLYRHHFKFAVQPPTSITVNYPQAEMKIDADGKRQEIYAGELIIPISLKGNGSEVTLQVDYQGCSKDGFCYPPMQKIVQLQLSNGTSGPTTQSSSLQMLLTDQYGVNELLYTQHIAVIILLFAGLGLLLSLTPCVLPMVPILTSIIVGQKHTVSTKRAFLLSSTYILGMAITYALAGVGAALLGNSLQVWLQQSWIIAVVSLMFVVLALSLFGLYELRLPTFLQRRLHNLSNKTRGGYYPGVFSMGVLSTLIVSPCVTAPLVGVLMYIAETGNVVFGAIALFAMGTGMGIPLLLIGMSAGRWMPKSGPWMTTIKVIFGFIMLGTAIWMLSRILQPAIVMILWGLLFIMAAIYVGFFLQRSKTQRLIVQTTGGLIGFAGLLLLLGGVGLSNPLSNWVHPGMVKTGQQFITVENLAAFNKQLMLAAATHQPVILDFYADWCESCVSMDKKVFTLPDVQRKLSHYTLLRADLSANSPADHAFLKFFNVIAPPTILFFDRNGHEINSERIVGEVNAKEFLMRLNKS